MFEFIDQDKNNEFQPETDTPNNLEGLERIKFSQDAYRIAKFGALACGVCAATIAFRMIPALSFGSVALKIVALSIVGRNAWVAHDEAERNGWIATGIAITLGTLGGEWDAILAIFQAINDFIRLYGVYLLVGVLLVTALLIALVGQRRAS